MMRSLPLISLAAMLTASCGGNAPEEVSSEEDMSNPPLYSKSEGTLGLEIQGHRGCRGLLPENTVAGFVLSIREGADVLEMDLCIAGDGSIIVSHEPWMSHEICTDPEGKEIPKAEERNHNLHAMSVAKIQSYGCGSRPHPRFPGQRQLPVHKPTLAEVVTVTETVPLLREGVAIRYNMEIKHHPDLVPDFCPDASQFVRMVLEEINRLGIANRTCIQSFSAEVMEALHEQAPNLTNAWLVESEGTVKDQLARLSYKPDIYSPNWQLLSAEDVHELQSQGIRVIPWTVNDTLDLYNVMQMGVDGIITDFPDRLYAMRD